MSPERRNILLAQYERCRADIVAYDLMLWQIPGVAYVVNAAVVGFVISRKVTGWGAAVAALLLFVLTAPLTLALLKNRLFQRARAEYALALLDELKGPDASIRELPTRTKEAWTIVDAHQDRGTAKPDERVAQFALRTLGRQSAYNAQLVTLLTTHVLQLGIVVLAPIVA